MGRRLLLKEGELAKHKSGRALTVYLFNDIILLTEIKAGREVVYRLVRANTFGVYWSEFPADMVLSG